MNIGNIKAFLGGEDVVRPDTKINQQLQAEGLKQARQFQQTTIVGSLSTQYSIAYKALGDALKQNVEVDGKQIKDNKEAKAATENESGFDFEAIVENVMQFVGGVIRNAAKSGASEDKLSDLFTQARDGVAKGVGLAKRDLSGLMTDELKQGIDRAESSLFSEIDALEQAIFAPPLENSEVSASFSAFRGSELVIRTRDGDQVTLRFEQQQSRYFEQTSTQTSITNQSAEDGQANANQQINRQQFGFFEQRGISLQIDGDIDEGELTAISDLVEQIAKLSDEFFNGDIEKAFTDSLNLGFNREELVGYSLQLTKASSASVVSAYEDVRQFTDNKPNTASRDIQPLLSYVDDMLKTMEQASNLLNSTSDYNNIVNEIVNQMDDEVKTPDLVSAINRFHQFNTSLLNSADSVINKEQGSV